MSSLMARVFSKFDPRNTLLSPRSCTSGFLRVYKFTEDGTDLELVHKMKIDEVPLAFQGRLVAGVGRIYDMKEKVLRKAGAS